MKKFIVPVLSLFVLFVPHSSLTQENGAKNQDTAKRSPVRLLPGYRLEITPGIEAGYGVRIWKAVSYTHLDVYKRQHMGISGSELCY